MRAVFAIALGGLAAAQTPAVFDATRVALSPPKIVAEIDTAKIKGELVWLAWSNDGATLYLKSAEFDRWRNERARHHLVPATGGTLTATDGTPIWAAGYWMWKSGTSAPGVPEMKFDTETQTQMTTAVGTVRDGGLSQSRGDPSQTQVDADYASAQQVARVTIKLKGLVIAQSTNKAVPPGFVWGWAPAPVGGLAFVDGKKRLVLLDRMGRTIEVPGATDVLLPAWSPDGTRLAYLQKKDKKKYVLNVVEVGTR
jgi:hypothetical protein